MTRYASRKFVVAMSAIASASWLVYSGHIADGVYSAVVSVIGPVTLAAVQRAQPADLVLRFNAERLRFYAKLTTFSTFGRGWVNRVAGNLDHAAADN